MSVVVELAVTVPPPTRPGLTAQADGSRQRGERFSNLLTDLENASKHFVVRAVLDRFAASKWHEAEKAAIDHLVDVHCSSQQN